MPPALRDKAHSNARFLEPTPNDLRALVLDYLCHHSYTGAAQAFLRDSEVKQLDADGDEIMPPYKAGDELSDAYQTKLALGELRREIRIHILSGRVDDAIALLNKHFPAVLSESAESTSESPAVDELGYIPPTSVDPTHLALNLRILAFIEAARTVPLPYFPPGSSATLPPAALSTPATDTDMDRHEGDVDDANVQLLHRAQNLYSEVNRLSRPNDRALYLDELAHVGGLLAYTVPESGPMAKYMTQERREAVANQIESAILYRTNQPTISRIELCTRYTSNLWSFLHDCKIKVPPQSTWPAGVSLPPDGKPHTSATVKDAGDNAVHMSSKKVAADKDSEELLPHFDLRLFLDTPDDR
ncbi:hypothetical protein A0H81_04302 [Grifola frondosa]|uniref:CTLH/CRA C-terminal to LisH motif domain-containing protein n=1 Tax=Grifola frondosa TaxID=5627 RepID=A0A1C7MG57_GRIFR|nr:hypothetical protein A0H81_04302 [Grifola frondosa]